MFLHLSHPEGPVGTHSRPLFSAQNNLHLSPSSGQKPETYMPPTCLAPLGQMSIHSSPCCCYSDLLWLPRHEGSPGASGSTGASVPSHSLGSDDPRLQTWPSLVFSSLSAKVSPSQDSFSRLLSFVHCAVPYPQRVTSTGRFYILNWIL